MLLGSNVYFGINKGRLRVMRRRSVFVARSFVEILFAENPAEEFLISLQIIISKKLHYYQCTLYIAWENWYLYLFTHN